MKTKRTYITSLDGDSTTPVLTGKDSDRQLKYRAILITYDVPAPHRNGLPKRCDKTPPKGKDKPDCSRCKSPCGEQLKRMRNKLNYWLRENCMRVSDSEYMVPQDTEEEIDRLQNEFYDIFVEPYMEYYRHWGLPATMSVYTSVFDAIGMVTKAAQILIDLFQNVEKTLDSLERAIRFHENSKDSSVFESNKIIFDPDGKGTEKAIEIDPVKIRQWYKKVSAYEEVLDDFLNEDTADQANLGTVDDVKAIMDTVQNRLVIAAQMVGIELETK